MTNSSKEAVTTVRNIPALSNRYLPVRRLLMDGSPNHIANLESDCAAGSCQSFTTSVSKINSDDPIRAGIMVRTEKR